MVPSLTLVTFTGTPREGGECGGGPGASMPTAPPSPSALHALNGRDRYGVPASPSKALCRLGPAGAGEREGTREPPGMKGKMQ